MSYYLYENEEQTGPYSLEELESLWRSHSISAEAFYCQQGDEEWLPLRTLLEYTTQSVPPPILTSYSSITQKISALPSRNGTLRKTIILTVSGSVFVAFMILVWLSLSADRTSLRAVGAVNRLPLAPSQTIADHFEIEYNVWDVAERVKETFDFETAPFRATVKILERGALSSRIKVQDASAHRLVGWVPNDWLENCKEPIKRRENAIDKMARQEADRFLGLTASALRAKLGKPKKTEGITDPEDGAYAEILEFDDANGKETFFLIEGKNGVVIDGEYRGVKLTPKYK